VSEKIMNYILDIVRHTRDNPQIRLGSSPRGSICLTRASQAHAALDGRDFVSPYDVKIVSAPVLAHRVILSPEALVEGVSPEDAIALVLEDVPVPAMGLLKSDTVVMSTT
jgi:MoxR-like ATPase